ncbi:DUF4265 domain-containing protein [Allobranchiibius sp. CTAmp26]|uniref:DUF4265 domain-containing protein n=1 Tax=Allobranchiibius sp. CTAmp26 TaxID=2815214 RepID=UPI001AA1B2F1|nr:DUF4265 domain-containing protein [Allobranchiibius sp. CTAmp26]MBO1756872.1 DUF4265 domain-containing protein [Allobranchiibius sp. CTAmp26]
MTARYVEHPSPTGRIHGGQLVPIPETELADVTVWLALPVEDGTQTWEGLRAATQPNGSYKICAVPLFAYDLNFGDRVAAVASLEGPLVATEILEDGGHFTFRVALHDGGASLPQVVAQFGAMGCLIEGWTDSLVGLSCEPAEAQSVADALTNQEHAGRLDYETGRQRAV